MPAPLEEYGGILATAGLRTVRTERHDQAMLRMIDQLEARLNMLRMTAPDKLTATGVDFDAAPRSGGSPYGGGGRALGYALLLIAERTTPAGSPGTAARVGIRGEVLDGVNRRRTRGSACGGPWLPIALRIGAPATYVMYAADAGNDGNRASSSPSASTGTA